MKSILIFFLSVIINNSIYAQPIFNHQDTLRGSITKERAWWDLAYYHLNVEVNMEKKSISGSNLIQYQVIKPHQLLQIELQEPLQITKIEQNGQLLNCTKDGYSYFIELIEQQKIGSINQLVVHYEGVPQESKKPPWQGGLTWKKDEYGNDWVTTTCQGDGASLWWPNKDHAYDEPDSMLISITVPKHLMDVSNGRLKSITENEKTKTYHWFVTNPINNYGVNMNIGDYVHFSETYKGLKGNLDCNYYVLRDNLEKAKKQFQEVPRMLEAFEYWFGPYPFYEDGYKLIEVPYAGMEHQSSITYGNYFENGYRKKDISGTGWGKQFDFIIVHESGHEWFGNSITFKDIADMWVHESFTSYAENLFLDYHFGKEACNEYVQGTRKKIINDKPIIGVYNVHNEGSADMYYKGANILHTLRQLIQNDSLWRSILKGLNKDFYHQTVTSSQIESYLSEKTGKDLGVFFNQYLRTIKVPTLEYIQDNERIQFRYTDVVSEFNMPLRIFINEKSKWLFPSKSWTNYHFKEEVKSFRFDTNFYVNYNRLPNH